MDTSAGEAIITRSSKNFSIRDDSWAELIRTIRKDEVINSSLRELNITESNTKIANYLISFYITTRKVREEVKQNEQNIVNAAIQRMSNSD